MLIYLPLDVLNLLFVIPISGDDSILPQLEFNNNRARGLLRFDCSSDFCEGEIEAGTGQWQFAGIE